MLQPNLSPELVLDVQRNRLLKRMVPPHMSNGDIELKKRHQGRADADPSEVEVLLTPSQDPDPLASAIMEAEKKEADAMQDGQDKKVVTTYGDIIRFGMLSKDEKGKKWLKIVALFAFLVDVIDVTLIFFLPCLYDFTPQVCA